MKFTDPKISLDKSWKFTPQVLFLIILGIIVNLIFSVSIWYSLKTILPPPPPPTEIPSKIPTENLFSVNAEVIGIDLEAKALVVKTILPKDWNRGWKLFITEETTLATFDSWQEAMAAYLAARQKVIEEGLDPSQLDKYFNEKIKKLSLGDFQFGDIVYVMSGDDLIKNTEIKKVKAILLQEI